MMTGFACPHCAVGKGMNCYIPLKTDGEYINVNNLLRQRTSTDECRSCGMTFHIREREERKTHDSMWELKEVTFEWLGKNKIKELQQELNRLEDRRREIQHQLQQLGV